MSAYSETANIVHNTIAQVSSLVYTSFLYSSLTSDDIMNPYNFKIESGSTWEQTADGSYNSVAIQANMNPKGADYYAFLSSVALTRRADKWVRSTSAGMSAIDRARQHFSSGSLSTYERSRAIRQDVVAEYIIWCKNSKVPILTLHDLSENNRIKNTAIKHFSPAINIIYVWEKSVLNASNNGPIANLFHQINTLPDYISDMVLSLTITAPTYTFTDTSPTASLPENMPYVRMVKDPIALILKEFKLITAAGAEVLNESGMSLLVHNELDHSGNYDGVQRAFHNQGVHYSIPKVDNTGLTSSDSISRRIVYTDGFQTPVPVRGKDSVFYTEQGIPKSFNLSIPLRPFFSKDGMAVPVSLLGLNSHLRVEAKLENLDLLFHLIPRGPAPVMPSQSGNPVISAEIQYRTATLPSQFYYQNIATLTQYVAPVRAYRNSVTPVATSNSIRITNPLRFMTNALVVFSQPDQSVLTNHSLLPREVAPDVWSSFKQFDVKQVRSLGKKLSRVGNITGIVVSPANDSFLPYTSGPMQTTYMNTLSDTYTLTSATEFGLYTEDPFLSDKARLVTTFTMGGTSAPAFADVRTEQVAIVDAADTANPPADLITVTSRHAIIPASELAALTGPPKFFLAQHVDSQAVDYIVKEKPVIKHIDFSPNGSQHLTREYTQHLSDASLVSDNTFDIPRRDGMIVFNFGNDLLDQNRASGFIQSSPQASYVEVFLHQDAIGHEALTGIKHNIAVLYYCTTVIIAQMSNYEHRFGNITM